MTKKIRITSLHGESRMIETKKMKVGVSGFSRIKNQWNVITIGGVLIHSQHKTKLSQVSGFNYD